MEARRAEDEDETEELGRLSGFHHGTMPLGIGDKWPTG